VRRLVLAAVALALLVPAVPAAGLPLGGLYGGELRVALQAQPSLDPIEFAGNRMVQGLAFDSLTRLGPDQLPVPWLATSWVPGAGTIALDLRAATWPDGSPITAQDVAWSFEKHLAGLSASGFTVAAVDADTVRFTFTAGGGEFLGNTALLPVAWKSASDTPTSNGPFVVVAQTATATDLAANDRHWGGRPYVDRVSFRHPFTLARNPDETTRADDAACALLKGQVHLIGWPVSQNDLTNFRDCTAGFGGWSDGTNRTLLNANATMTMPHSGVTEDPGLRLLYLGMNTQRPPLTQPVLRQALSRAIDRDLITQAIEPNTDVADSVITRANEAWANETVPRFRVERVASGTAVNPSLEKVNAFLDETGYLDTDGDGYRQDPSGAPFSFTLLTPDQATDARTAKYLDMVTKFQSIGMNVTQQEMTPANLTAAVDAGAFDLYVDVLEVGGEPAFLFDLFHSTGARNLVRLASPELDSLLETARDATDGAARHRAVTDALGWIAVNAPLATIGHQRAIFSYDRMTFDGWTHALGGIASFWSFPSVHVTQRGPLVVRVDSVQSTLRSGGRTTVLVRVLDALDNPVEGVDLEFTGEGLSDAAGVTDAQGEFDFTFTAPEVSGPREYPITIDAAKAGYAGASGSRTIVVNPRVMTFAVSVTRGDAQMPSGNTTSVRVVVYDETLAAPAVGVGVTLSVEPTEAGGVLASPTGITDGTGVFETTFSASVAVTTRFLIAASVSVEGYEDARATTTVEVAARGGTAPTTPALDTLSMVVVVAGLAAIFGAYRRRKWLARKP